MNAKELADKIEADGLCCLCDYGENYMGHGERKVVPFPPDADRELIVKALRAFAPPEERTLGGWPLVKRYSQLGSGMVSTFEGPNRIPSGDWVAASDYDRLLQLAVDLEYRATNAEAASSPQRTPAEIGRDIKTALERDYPSKWLMRHDTGEEWETSDHYTSAEIHDVRWKATPIKRIEPQSHRNSTKEN